MTVIVGVYAIQNVYELEITKSMVVFVPTIKVNESWKSQSVTLNIEGDVCGHNASILEGLGLCSH